MVKFVIKSDGSRVPFSQEKMEMAIRAACDDVALADDLKIKVVKEMSALVVMDLEGAQEEIPSSDLREIILSKLDAKYPEVADAWREYEESKNV